MGVERLSSITFRTVIDMSNKARKTIGLLPRERPTEGRAAKVSYNDPIQTDPNIVATPEGYTGKYRIYSAAEFAQRSHPEWIIKGVIPNADIGMIFGPSGSGKTFFVLDLACAIARGSEWRGHRVHSKRVVYLAAEGSGGVTLRLRAYARWHELSLEALRVGVLPHQPNFLQEEDVSAVIGCIRAAGGADLVFVDTLAQVTPGADENAAQDMSAALQHARQIKMETGAMVILVHHSGKDLARGARGWSGLKGAMDFEIEIRKDGTRHSAKITKSKDGPSDETFHFTLEGINLGKDPEGDPMTSAVVVPDYAPWAEEKPEKLGRSQELLLTVIANLFALTGGPVTRESVIREAVDQLPDDRASNPRRDQRRSNLNRTLGKMIDRGMIHAQGDLIALTPFPSNDNDADV